ncbi:MAG: inorganic phosphate transporter [Bacteroidetes bacterium]|nr:MAG: inorganic phosphate transporter [Bacteroidota bacterium]
MLFLIFLSSGLFLGWSLGANDAANIFGSAVGSRMISFKRAAWIASIFVVIGAVFQGQGGSETLNELGTVDALAGAFTVSLSAAFIVLIMTRRSLPVSTSQAIVGAIVGWSMFTGNPTDYKVLGKIVSTWVSGPILGMIFAALLFLLLRRVLQRAKIHIIKLDSYIRTALIIVGAFGAYSLGANNIANVMGVFVSSAPNVNLNFGLFQLDGVQILFLLGGLAISVGIFTYSKRVMEKVGNGILALTPEAAIVVVLSQSLVLFLFSSKAFASLLISLGLPPLPMVPVSSTQLVIGALLGIGMVKGMREVKITALGGVALGWVITPILAGTLTFFSLFFIQNVFGLKVSTLEIERAGDVITQLQSPQITRQINMILPGLLVFSVGVIISLIYMFFRQQKLRLKTENELLMKQNEIFNSQRALKDLEINSIQAHNTVLATQLELKRQEYNSILLNIKEQKEFLENITNEIHELIGNKNIEKRDEKLKELSLLLKQRMSFTREINDFYEKIEETHKGFTEKLQEKHPDLTDNDVRLAILVRLGLSSKEIATLMNISPKSVEIARYRFRKKLGLKERESMGDLLKNI